MSQQQAAQNARCQSPPPVPVPFTIASICEQKFSDSAFRLVWPEEIDSTIDSEICCVCLSAESYKDQHNEIVFCSGCNIPVHQKCYFIATIPEDDWFCQRCALRNTAPMERAKPCDLCPSSVGAFFATTSGGWAHVQCALYTPNVRFHFGPSLKIDWRGAVNQRGCKDCAVCGTNYGVCAKCSVDGCSQYFHVSCSEKSKGYHRDLKTVAKKAEFRLFCPSHNPQTTQRRIETSVPGTKKRKSHTPHRFQRVMNEEEDGSRKNSRAKRRSQLQTKAIQQHRLPETVLLFVTTSGSSTREVADDRPRVMEGWETDSSVSCESEGDDNEVVEVELSPDQQRTRDELEVENKTLRAQVAKLTQELHTLTKVVENLENRSKLASAGGSRVSTSSVTKPPSEQTNKKTAAENGSKKKRHVIESDSEEDTPLRSRKILKVTAPIAVGK
eukprot:GILK01005250.1.p1 GENE.GILK01005250.1~~GILK01005250.1.p1  ORF type:complete len:442 (+),score=49.61 GILK01005250.1:39-1364(+)